MPREGTTIKIMALKEGNILYSSRGLYLTQGHGLAEGQPLDFRTQLPHL